MSSYFDHLADRLHGKGIPEDHVAVMIDDLAAHISETGTDPETEFGRVSDFAERLLPAGNDGDGPATPPDGEPWRWRADAFHELRWLETLGNQGWEVERVDSAGRFVSRRDAEHPQQWEYRREVIGSRNLEAELAPEGWESCGSWAHWAYFKRSKAALIGPEAMLHAPARRPNRNAFLSRRFYLYAIIVLVVTVGASAAAVAGLMTIGDRYVGGGFAKGALIGAIIAAVGLLVLCVVLVKRAEARADRDHVNGDRVSRSAGTPAGR